MAINQRIPTSVGTLALADDGSGEAVICWPSLFADRRFYGPLRDALGDGWRCILIDGPGFGQSDPPRGGVPPERVAAFVDAFRSYDARAAAVTTRTTLTQFPGLADALPQLSVPTVILMGGKDELYPVESAMPLARLAPNARIEVLPECGHLAPLESPEAVAVAVKSIRGSSASLGGGQ